MSKRQGVLASHTVKVPDDTSGAKALVSAELWCHWPPAATLQEIHTAMLCAFGEALDQINQLRKEEQ